jgi:hypothetical protein
LLFSGTPTTSPRASPPRCPSCSPPWPRGGFPVSAPARRSVSSPAQHWRPPRPSSTVPPLQRPSRSEERARPRRGTSGEHRVRRVAWAEAVLHAPRAAACTEEEQRRSGGKAWLIRSWRDELRLSCGSASAGLDYEGYACQRVGVSVSSQLALQHTYTQSFVATGSQTARLSVCAVGEVRALTGLTDVATLGGSPSQSFPFP